MERAEEGGEDGGDENDNENDKRDRYKEEEEDTKKKTVKNKQATAETLVTNTDNCDDVLDFFQDVAVKSPQFTAAPLSLCADKLMRIWFRRWSETNLTTPHKTVPQDHTGLKGVLSDVTTRLQTAEALPPRLHCTT